MADSPSTPSPPSTTPLFNTRGPSKTSNMAAARVFAIPELLESILLHLPSKDLLLSQRTATTFRDVIKASINLQQALFLHTATQAHTATATASKAASNPLLLRACGRVDQWHLNLSRSEGWIGLWCTRADCHDTLYMDERLYEFAKSETSKNFDPSPSWLGMHLNSAPTATIIKFDFELETDQYVDGCMEVQTVTMRDLMGLVISLYTAASRYRGLHEAEEPGSGEAAWQNRGRVKVRWEKWEQSFTAEQLGQTVEAPGFCYMAYM